MRRASGALVGKNYRPLRCAPKKTVNFQKLDGKTMRPLIRLVKPSSSSSGRTRFWEARTLESDPTKAVVEWGLVDGKTQTVSRSVAEGKLGKDAKEQLEMELRALARRKMDRDGYVVESLEENALATSTADVPRPMLAQAFDPDSFARFAESTDGETAAVHVQPKLDGIRCMADLETGALWSRARKPILGLDHISRELIRPSEWRSRMMGDVRARFVDGELYRHDFSFQEITSVARSSVNRHDDAGSLQLHLFDAVVTYDPNATFDKSWTSRWRTSSRRVGIDLMSRSVVVVVGRKVVVPSQSCERCLILTVYLRTITSFWRVLIWRSTWRQTR